MFFVGITWWTFRIFLIFFCSGERKGESDAPGGGRGNDFLLKMPGGGVSRAGAGGRGEGLGGRLRGIVGGGANIFSGPKFPPRIKLC